ncbi:MAG: DDE-type integrase/transposase/recombinase [Campylobacteraceae bacterium]
MTSKELGIKIEVSYQAIQKATLKAKQELKKSFTIKGIEVVFCEVDGIGGRGKVYQYEIKEIKPETIPSKIEKTPLHVKTFEHPNQYFMRATKEEQHLALKKEKLCKSYLEREKWVTFEEWSKDKSDIPSKQHFFRWVRLYKAGIKQQNVLDHFIDTRGRPKNTLKMTKEMQEMCERYIIRSDIHPNNYSIYQLMRVAFGDELPSSSTIERYIKRYKNKEKILVAFATNPEKAKGKYMAAHGSMSAKAKYKNQYWELDGTKADIITSDGKRQAIIAAIDIYSRRVIVTVEEKSTSYAITRNLREGILRLGIPENVITDNGRDYISTHFGNVCTNLKINQKTVAPYSGDRKPHIERFFGTLTRELFRQLEGFCGHNVAERQAIRDRLSFEQKLIAKKKWQLQQFNEDRFVKIMKKEGVQVHVPLSVDELRAYIKAWVENIYEHRVHRGIKMTPMEKYTQDITPAKTIKDEKTLDILLGEWLEYTVGKKGVMVRRDGKEAQYAHIKLIEYIGEKVYVSLSSDMGTAYIYDNEMQYICEAIDESLAGISREAIRAIHKDIKKLERENLQRVKKVDELAKKLGDPTIKDIVNLEVETPRAAKLKVVDKPLIEIPQEKELINGRPIFESDFEALVWAIENKKEDEFKSLIDEREEIYEMAKRDVEYRKKKTSKSA